jgi:hypothetical protein
MNPLYFHSKHLPKPRGEYVVWCDGMGTGRALGTSLHHAANFIFKLHTAFDLALRALPNDHEVRVYPLMDGMYIAAPRRQHVEIVLRRAFSALADEFLSFPEFSRHFLVRGAIAYGITLHGEDIDEKAFIRPGPGVNARHAEFADSHLNRTRARLLLSAAMEPAYKAESSAPPFGLYVHESALNAPQLADCNDCGFTSRLWRWWRSGDPSFDLSRRLWPALTTYFEEAMRRPLETGYSPDSAKRHREWAAEYFDEFVEQK